MKDHILPPHSRILLYIVIANTCSIQATIFDDALKELKKIGATIESVGKTTTKSIEATGKKAVQSTEKAFADLGRKMERTALQATLDAERKALKLAESTVNDTLLIAEKTAQAGLDAAKAVLDAAQKSSPVLLRGSAVASKKILDTFQKGGVATLRGGRWVVDKGLGQVDVTRLWCETTLEAFKVQVISDMKIDYTLLGKSLTTTIHFDLHEPVKSLTTLVDIIVNTIRNEMLQPLKETLAPQKTVTMPPTMQTYTVTQDAIKAADKVIAELAAQERQSAVALTQTAQQLQKKAS